MFTKIYWKDAIERAMRSAAQAFIVVAGLSETVVGALSVNWLAGLQAAGWMAVATILYYIISPPKEMK